MAKDLSKGPSAPEPVPAPNPRDLNPPTLPTRTPKVHQRRRAPPVAKASDRPDKAPEPRPPMLLIYLPDAPWQIRRVGSGPDAERYLTPRIVEQLVEAGSGGVWCRRDGSWVLDGLLSNEATRGGIVLDWETFGYCGPLADEGPLAKVNVCAWESVAPDGAVYVTQAGQAVYRDFVRKLTADGVLRQPREDDLENLRERTAHLLRAMAPGFVLSHAGDTHVNPGNDPEAVMTVAGDLKFVEAQLAALRAAPDYVAPESDEEAAPVGFM